MPQVLVGGRSGFLYFVFFFQAEDGIRDYKVTGVQTCALPIWGGLGPTSRVRTTSAPTASCGGVGEGPPGQVQRLPPDLAGDVRGLRMSTSFPRVLTPCYSVFSRESGLDLCPFALGFSSALPRDT